MATRFTLSPAPWGDRGSAPAQRFLVDGGPATVGIIASVSAPFCSACDRVRLTADGQVRNCLFSERETDLRGPLRDGASDDDLLALVDLGHKRDAYVETLSRGMKQRLCLARTLTHDPQVLILDEPASGLDPRARIEIRELLKELHRMGKTIVISSHILPELAELCSTIGIIERGKLLMHGPIEDVYRRINRNRIINIKFLDKAEVGLSIIRSLPETQQVEVENNHATVELAAGDEQVAFVAVGQLGAVVGMRAAVVLQPGQGSQGGSHGWVLADQQDVVGVVFAPDVDVPAAQVLQE